MILMRTNCLWSLAALLPALSAQDAPPRPAFVPAPQAEEALPSTTQSTTPDARNTAGSRAITRVQFDRPRADEPLWAMGAAWKASFDGSGFTTIPFFGSSAPRNFPLRF